MEEKVDLLDVYARDLLIYKLLFRVGEITNATLRDRTSALFEDIRTKFGNNPWCIVNVQDMCDDLYNQMIR